MGLMNVDREKCKKDGICAGECPFRLIQMDEEKGPELPAGAEPFCLGCGHCVAVCPHGAMSHENSLLAQSPAIDKNLKISQDQAAQFLRSRRSVRFYKDKPVEKEAINDLIHLARYAPTASNAQPIQWTVFNDPEQINGLAGMAVDWMRAALEKDPTAAQAPYMPLVVGAWDMGVDGILHKAPAVVLAHTHKQAGNGLVDLTLALSYLDLYAPTLGLGTCWAGLLQGALIHWPPLRGAMGLPEDHTHHYGMMLGYPLVKYSRLPERKAPSIVWK